ncbi:MAG: rhomboid family intramembrane serine protease [Phycisphaerae bacterium]|nr:rhomboid family intramembrane serine protease [Phycisphaerae bacterium]
MMFPIGTDRDGGRPALATVLLILVTIVAYGLMQMDVGARFVPRDSGVGPIDAFLSMFALSPRNFRWWNLFSYQFVHDPTGIGHLGMNMLGLWTFGKPVESHLGFWKFLILYLTLGAIAGAAHCALSPAPVLGASGSVMGILGLFVTFFPRSTTQFVVVFLGISTMAIQSLWVAGFYVVVDLLLQLLTWSGMADSRVSNAAHLAGMGSGVGLGLLMLKVGIVPRGEWDLLYSLKQWRKRRQIRAALRHTGPTAKRDPTSKAPDVLTDEVAQLRATIQAALKSPNPASAIDGYRRLLSRSPGAALPADAQLELANRVLASGDSGLAAEAYEAFLATYPADTRTTEISLLLSVVLVRRLGKADQGRRVLLPLRDRYLTADQKELVTQLIDECGGAREGMPGDGGRGNAESRR